MPWKKLNSDKFCGFGQEEKKNDKVKGESDLQWENEGGKLNVCSLCFNVEKWTHEWANQQWTCNSG